MPLAELESYDWTDELPVLIGGSTCLRALRSSDTSDVVAVLGDDDALRLWAGSLVTTSEEALAFINRTHGAFLDRRFFQWAITTEDKVIGLCKLYDCRPEHASASLGFALAPTSWGSGFMTDALTCLLAFCFQSLGLRRIEAFTHPENTPALATLKRQGFVTEGLARQRYVGRHGVQDAVMLGLLNSEWTRKTMGKRPHRPR